MSNPQKALSEGGASPPTLVHTTKEGTLPGSTVGIDHAEDCDGRRFTFAGDWRPMLAIAELLDDGYQVEFTLDG